MHILKLGCTDSVELLIEKKKKNKKKQFAVPNVFLCNTSNNVSSETILFIIAVDSHA